MHGAAIPRCAENQSIDGKRICDSFRGSVTGNSLAAVAVLILTWATFLAWLPGMATDSLWFDDLWIGALANDRSTWEAITMPAPASPGFTLLLRGMIALFGHRDRALQALPFVFGLTLIPLIAFVVTRITKSAGLGVVAAALIALNSLTAQYSLFVKEYTLDAVCSAVLLLFAGAAFAEPIRPRSVASVSCFGIVALFFAPTSAFYSLLIVNLAVVFALFGTTESGSRKRIVATAILFDVAMAAGLHLLRSRATPVLRAFWRPHFLPYRRSWSAIASFVDTHGLGALREGLPDPLARCAPWLVAGGLASLVLARDEWRRRYGLFVVLAYGSAIYASSLRLYPLGGGRTDLYSFPLAILLVCLGISFVIGLMPEWCRRTPVAIVALASVCVAVFRPLHPLYFQLDDALAIAQLRASATDDDGILIYPWACFDVAYYGQWPFEVVSSPFWENGFEVQLRRPGAVTIARSNVNAAQASIDRFFAEKKYHRVFYVAHRVNKRVPERLVFDALKQHDYIPERIFRSRKTRVYVFREATV